MPGPASPADDALLAAVARATAGQFAIERELGRGGMGVVYLAREVRLDRMVALKVLPAELYASAATRERFLREARTAARLAHPNVVPVYRAEEADDLAFFTMAYVDGESLGDRVRERGALPPAEVVRVLREVAWALAYAHARGVVHRDVKPENILLERGTMRALVTDFGIARDLSALSGDAARLTLDGHVLGTLHYLSPEQALGQPLDGRSDLYALGVVAYHALSGRLPFDDASGPAVIVAHVTRPAPPLARVAPHVPAALAAAIDRCLAKDPEQRWACGEAFADALEAALRTAAIVAPGAALPEGVPEVVSEAQAEAIWRRAAQLQAEALRRLERRRDLLAPRATDAAGDDAMGGTVPVDGYRLAAVAEAAREAGISGQYVAMALAELPRGAAVPAVADAGVGDRQATRFLGTEERSIAVSHVVAAPPGPTLRALGEALRHSPFDLQLREVVGPHPLDGGVLVFDLPGVMVGAGGVPAGQVNMYWMGTHQQLEARQVQLTLRALPGDPTRTELTMTCDLRPGLRRNVRASQWIAGTLGGLGSGLTGAVLAKGAAVAASAAVLGPAALVGLGLAGASLAWYRWLYPSVLRKARGEMEGALRAVSGALHAEAVFGASDAPRPNTAFAAPNAANGAPALPPPTPRSASAGRA